MQKKRQLKTCIVVVVLMCLLTISMTFQTICVKTISDNYINSLIVNQIIDLIIDEETDANFQQINQLQNKIKKSDALYQLNRYAFDQSMRNTNKNKIKLDQKELQKFSTSCKKMIKDELNISIEEKQIMNILKQNQFWNKMIHRMKNKLSSFSKIFVFIYSIMQASVYKGYKRDKIEMRGDRAEISDFPLYLNTVAGGLDRRDQTIGGFSFVVKIYALPVVEIIGQLLYLLGRYGFNAQFGDCL